jgi:hypothetical protein
MSGTDLLAESLFSNCTSATGARRKTRAPALRVALESCYYSPSQLTRLFQSTNAPFGLSRQAQTCNSKKGAGMP